jgi:predicted RNA-binding Zn-ribbon protein involved in translation (DUF1610 family)
VRPTISLSGEFDAQPKKMLVPGHWYIGFACEACGNGIAVLDDPTGTGAISLSGDGLVRLTCPNCGKSGAHAAGTGRIFQAVNGGLTEPRDVMTAAAPSAASRSV